MHSFINQVAFERLNINEREYAMKVGKNIKLFRTIAGLKQKELAAKIEVKDSYLSSIENEKKEPSLSLLKKISEKLNIPIAMFFWENIDGKEEDTPEARLKKLLFQLTSELQSSHGKPQKN